MKFPKESYHLTILDFSRMKGFSPREVFKKIFRIHHSHLPLFKTKYQDISIYEAYLNRNLFEYGEMHHIIEDLKRNRIYAPFFLSEWEGDNLFGYVVFNPENMRYSCILGNLTTNDWVMPPHRPKPVLEQNKGMMGSFKEGVPGGWFSDLLILFPMLYIQPTLNHPEGI